MKKILRAIRDLPFILTPFVMALRLLKRLGLPINSKIYQHFPYHGLIVVEVPGGKTFKTFSKGVHIENGLYWEGIETYEKGSIGIWMYLARQSSAVLDIGANSGIYSLVAWASGAKHIHAFEPVKRVYMQLVQNISANGENAPIAWNKAVSDHQGVLELIDPGGFFPVAASLSKEFYKQHVGNYITSVVDVTDIDHFYLEVGLTSVDLVKLDIEGHELIALKGMLNTISNFKPWILIEVYDEYEAELKDYFETNFQAQYRWVRVNENDGSDNRNVLLVPFARCAHELPVEIQGYLFPEEKLK